MVGACWQIAAWQSRVENGRLFGLCRQELSHRKAGCASISGRRAHAGLVLKEKRGRLIGGNQTAKGQQDGTGRGAGDVRRDADGGGKGIYRRPVTRAG